MNTFSPLFLSAAHYLALHEVGLAPPRREVAPILQEAVLVVAYERSKRPDKEDDGEDVPGDEPIPMSDAALMAAHGRLKNAHIR